MHLRDLIRSNGRIVLQFNYRFSCFPNRWLHKGETAFMALTADSRQCESKVPAASVRHLTHNLYGTNTNGL